MGDELEQPGEEQVIDEASDNVEVPESETLEPGSFKETPESLITESIDRTQVQLTRREISRVEEFRPERWSQLDDPDRIESLQRLENRLAEITGRAPMTVTDADLSNDIVGETDWDNKKIYIDKHALGNRELALRTQVHESRHAYQMDAIENPWKDDRRRVEAWAENAKAEHYIEPHLDEERYREQALEQDAQAFEDEVMGEETDHA